MGSFQKDGFFKSLHLYGRSLYMTEWVFFSIYAMIALALFR